MATPSLCIMSSYLEDAILNWVFKGGTNFPEDNYVALFTTIPWKSGSGTEVTGGGYTRIHPNQPYVRSATLDASTYTNSGSISFLEATSDWGTVTHWAITSASEGMSGSGLLFFGEFINPKEVVEGDYIKIPERDLEINLYNAYSDYLADMVLNRTLNGSSTGSVTFASPGSSIYLALFQYGQGVGLTEVTGNNYSRISASTWGTITSGSISNSASCVFPMATGAWGNITAVAITCNHAEPSEITINEPVPDILYIGNLDEVQNILSGDFVKFGTNRLYVVSDGTVAQFESE
jgi:hypothetical protein